MFSFVECRQRQINIAELAESTWEWNGAWSQRKAVKPGGDASAHFIIKYRNTFLLTFAQNKSSQVKGPHKISVYQCYGIRMWNSFLKKVEPNPLNSKFQSSRLGQVNSTAHNVTFIQVSV